MTGAGDAEDATPAEAAARAKEQRLGLVAAIALVMGNTIGSGVFLLPASLAPFGWNALAGWIATIAGALVLAAVLAALTRARPEAGGPTGFVTAAFGEVAGFFVSWIYLVSVWTAVVTIAVAAISYASSLVPALASAPALAALVLMLALAALNLRGARLAGDFQMVTLAIKLVPLLAVAGIAAALVLTGKAAMPALTTATLTLPSVNAAAALTLWALVGFECASVAAGKVRNPAVNVPRATLWGTGITGLLYFLVCSAITLLLPADVVATSPAPFATFVGRYWDDRIAGLVAVFAVVSCVGALNGWTLVQGEMTRDMARRGMLPAALAVDDARGTPRRALALSALIGAVLVLMNASRSMQGMFDYLVLLSTSATLWLYLAVALAALRLKVSPVLAMLGALYALWTLYGAGVGASGLSLGLMVLGLPVWWWSRHGAPAR